MVGGHVAAGCLVNTTAEVVIGSADGLRFHRALDPETGYPELQIGED